jgi:CDP-diacylglycerol--glycerol-3-phosphate 3-phosphatidyltransferase
MVVAADTLGKLKTTFQVIGLSGLVLPFRDQDLPGWMQAPGEVLYYIAVVLVGVAVVLTMVSGAQFFLGVWRERDQLRRPPRN